ncbi:helix-turn-helix transcriptional regulator [Salmonella enterica]|nr:XRE family transcriptional regulator [Salmonella enterica]EBW1589850.1 XRE family transcriptional regulator [Salmonella enterica subsp. diarizonae serovar 61:r:z]ECA7919360.1 XRE family transcriptional regulator [Salmonella enterica subsp. enterica serovar Chichester]EDR7604204.1 helix-turn-helix transcriptional regulator [Salmonella enterica subsp. diarizonae]EAT8026334.1 helix-turn-helix transcriptional regulator [Salmonella enterica]
MTSVYSNEYQMVIKALREARVAGHITQEDLGRALGKPQSFIAKVENGERRLDVVEFVYLCRLVSVDPVSIISKL